MVFSAFLSACKEDESLACMDIIHTCQEAYTKSAANKTDEKSIRIWSNCFDVVKKYNCNMYKFKTVLFGYAKTDVFDDYKK
jgi:hypothetical protein